MYPEAPHPFEKYFWPFCLFDIFDIVFLAHGFGTKYIIKPPFYMCLLIEAHAMFSDFYRDFTGIQGLLECWKEKVCCICILALKINTYLCLSLMVEFFPARVFPCTSDVMHLIIVIF